MAISSLKRGKKFTFPKTPNVVFEVVKKIGKFVQFRFVDDPAGGVPRVSQVHGEEIVNPI